MRILSFVYGEHSCGLAVIENGRPKYCYEEERFARVKTSTDWKNLFFRLPILSMYELQYKNQENINDFDVYLFPKISGDIGTKVNDYFLTKVSMECNFYIDVDKIKSKSFEYDHHGSHCALAYYTSGFVDKKCLVVSIDALGSNYSAKYYLGESGKMKYIDGIEGGRVSFGMYYAMLTEFLGFQRLKDEGKVVGMSSHGKLTDEMITVFENVIGQLDGIKTRKLKDNFEGQMFIDFYTEIFKKIGSRFYKNTSTMNDIAATGQIVFENKVCELLNNLHDLYPEYDHVCLSGGIFANVKLNKRINELTWVKEVYITPVMGDEGLTLGSGLLYNSINNNQDVFRLNDVYFGSGYSEREIQDTIKCENFVDKIVCEDLDIDNVARLLDQQHIIGLFQGRMEYGPRALGNRTILADARKVEAYDKLNDRLNRNDCMPFAPVVLEEYADDIFKIEKSRYTADFMTMLYDTRVDWHDRIPSALHPIDKTARIQIVYQEKNKLLYDILKSFYIRTSVPVLINTSFNVHEEPIVCWPENAMNHLVNGIVDYLIIENKLYSLKK